MPVVPPPDPALQQIKQQATTDQLDAVQARVQGRNTDLLLRYGTRAALSGAKVGTPMLGW